MKITYYPHDCDAQHDPKIIKMISELGWESYGLYHALLEDLCKEAPDHKLHMQCDCIAWAKHTQCELVNKIINNYDLFIIEDDYFSSKRMNENVKIIKQKSDHGRMAAQKRWGNNAYAMQVQCEPNTIKVNKKKEKESKEDKKNKSNIRAGKFKNQVFEFKSSYDEEMLNEFFEYWTEPNKSYSKLRFEMEETWHIGKRLARWANSNYQANKSPAQQLKENGKIDEATSGRYRNLAEQSKRFKRYMVDAKETAADPQEIRQILRQTIEKLKPIPEVGEEKDGQ